MMSTKAIMRHLVGIRLTVTALVCVISIRQMVSHVPSSRLSYTTISIIIGAIIFAVFNHGPVFAASTIDYYSQNDIIYFDKNGCRSNDALTAQLVGGNNVEKVLNYLQSKGLTLEQAAGVVGNFQWESGSDTLNPKGSDGKAVGIGQWQDSRLTKLKQYGGGGWDNIDTQIQYLGLELGLEQSRNGVSAGTEKASFDALKNAKTPEEAAVIWNKTFERSGDANSPDSLAYRTRQSNARKIYDQYKNGGTGSLNTGLVTNGCTATGKTNAAGYAFPVSLGKNEVSNGYSWPCPGICHHDGTPAFDLSKKAQDDSTTGTGVIAIYKGTIQRFNNSYAGQAGCQSFQLVGDDGWWYWYGHVEAANVQEGSKVSAGQQIATIGRRTCTGNGSYPHLHIDRGSPQGHYGGDVCCRDPGFNSLINQLYDELSGGTPSAL